MDKMASFKNLTTVWETVKEVDLRPLKEEALRTINIAVVGTPGSGRHELVDQMRSRPGYAQTQPPSPLIITDLSSTLTFSTIDLIILMLGPMENDLSTHRELANKWSDDGKRVLVLYNEQISFDEGHLPIEISDWDALRVFLVSVSDRQSLKSEFVPAVIETLPEYQIALGRQFPLFRENLAQTLINETCFSNAVFALSTGIAETVPVLNIPLNVADMIILTKAQAFMAYKLGLTLGYSTDWQDYIKEFGGVIGSGFLWRQLARSLVGFIPLWGIVPKVAVSYAGTYVVGHVILGWYHTGRHLTGEQINALYKQAFTRGKEVGTNLVNKRLKPRIRSRRDIQMTYSDENEPFKRKKFQFRLGRSKQTSDSKPTSSTTCQECGKTIPNDANFCQHCGNPIASYHNIQDSPV
jgi:uncharacterized protein (DUF697 family)